ncbi:MAG: hypothetical protein ABSA86_13185 [Oryzomonas sp.]|jgi:hypothetical protein
MDGDTRSACLALALLLAGMSAAGRFAAEEDETMKDPQHHNHQAWQASPYGRSWLAEAEMKSRICLRDAEVRKKNLNPPQRHRDTVVHREKQ